MRDTSPNNIIVKVDLGQKFSHATVLARFERIETVPTLRGKEKLCVVCPVKILDCEEDVCDILSDIVTSNTHKNNYRIAIEPRQILETVRR